MIWYFFSIVNYISFMFYFDKEFPSIAALYKYCIETGMDPNYEITFNGKGTGEELFEIMVG